MLKSFGMSRDMLFLLVAAVALVAVLMHYSNDKKSSFKQGYVDKNVENHHEVQDEESLGDVRSLSNNDHVTQMSDINPGDLLPAHGETQFSDVNPAASTNPISDHLLLPAVNSSLRNSNLQVRSEPPNPMVNVGPWNNSTISSGTSPYSFEINRSEHDK